MKIEFKTLRRSEPYQYECESFEVDHYSVLTLYDVKDYSGNKLVFFDVTDIKVINDTPQEPKYYAKVVCYPDPTKFPVNAPLPTEKYFTKEDFYGSLMPTVVRSYLLGGYDIVIQTVKP